MITSMQNCITWISQQTTSSLTYFSLQERRTQPSNGRVVHPVDMALNPKDGTLLVLDRGAPVNETPSAEDFPWAVPKLVQLSRNNNTWQNPQTYELTSELDVEQLIEPTALAINNNGEIIIADAGNQFSSQPANLFRATLAEDNGMVQSLLNEHNPLIFPISLAFEHTTSLLVCDTGLRWGWDENPKAPDPLSRIMAEPAAIYRVDLAQSLAISLVTSDRRLVHPCQIALDRQRRLLLVDRGAQREAAPHRNWRAKQHEFGLVIHFSQQRSTTVDDRKRLLGRILDALKPHQPCEAIGWTQAQTR